MPPQELLDRLTYRLQTMIPRVLFLTLPLLALGLSLLYRGRGFYVDHLRVTRNLGPVVHALVMLELWARRVLDA